MQRKGNGLAIVLIAIGAVMLLGILPHLIHGIFGILFRYCWLFSDTTELRADAKLSAGWSCSSGLWP